MRFPDKPPTPTEYAVIAVLISGSLILLGIIGLVVALRAPAGKHEQAQALEHYAIWSLGIGIAVAIVFWLVRKLTN